MRMRDGAPDDGSNSVPDVGVGEHSGSDARVSDVTVSDVTGDVDSQSQVDTGPSACVLDEDRAVGVICGGVRCAGSTSACCQSPGNPYCISHLEGTCGGNLNVPIQRCDGSEDCPLGEKCCTAPNSWCRATCGDPYPYFICHDNTDCPAQRPVCDVPAAFVAGYPGYQPRICRKACGQDSDCPTTAPHCYSSKSCALKTCHEVPLPKPDCKFASSSWTRDNWCRAGVVQCADGTCDSGWCCRKADGSHVCDRADPCAGGIIDACDGPEDCGAGLVCCRTAQGNRCQGEKECLALSTGSTSVSNVVCQGDVDCGCDFPYCSEASGWRCSREGPGSQYPQECVRPPEANQPPFEPGECAIGGIRCGNTYCIASGQFCCGDRCRYGGSCSLLQLRCDGNEDCKNGERCMSFGTGYGCSARACVSHRADGISDCSCHRDADCPPEFPFCAGLPRSPIAVCTLRIDLPLPPPIDRTLCPALPQGTIPCGDQMCGTPDSLCCKVDGQEMCQSGLTAACLASGWVQCDGSEDCPSGWSCCDQANSTLCVPPGACLGSGLSEPLVCNDPSDCPAGYQCGLNRTLHCGQL